jgi:hypothetical protein
MTSFKIAGLDYEILEKSPEEMEGKIGLANFNTQQVWVNTHHTTQTKKIAVWHEIIHLLSDAYGLSLTENQVKIGTHALIAFLADNPNFKNIYGS